MKYSLDTSGLVSGWRRHYPPENFPSLWERFDELIKNGDLRATEEVYYEIEKQDDELLQWVKARDQLFVPIDAEIQTIVQNILIKHKKLVDDRKSRSGADPFVIALAEINGCAVITDETFSNSVEKRPHIPDVCQARGIRCINLLGLIREQRWIFKL
jgi:Domain of unknown function (DUF4411)